MINKLSGDDAFKNLATQELQGKQIAKLLFYLRCKSALSQKELADKIGCSQSRISKLESANDKEVSLDDLLMYSKALKLQLEIGFADHSVKIVDQIKYHALKMHHYMDQLCELAKDDPEIIEGVRKFYGDALFNVLNLITSSYKRLPTKKKTAGAQELPIQISVPELK